MAVQVPFLHGDGTSLQVSEKDYLQLIHEIKMSPVEIALTLGSPFCSGRNDYFTLKVLCSHSSELK